jgi:hypothetical protein
MALIKESDIKKLQEKKDAAQTAIKATKDAFDKSFTELESESAKLANDLAEQRDENPNTLESLNSLIKDFEAKLLIPGKVRQEIDPTGISSWGETVYEIIDNDFVNDNEDSWTEIRAARDKSLKESLDDAGTAITIKFKDLVEAISDEKDGETFDKGYNALKSSYEAATKATVEFEIAKIVKENAEELLTKFIKDEVDNSDLVIRFEKEKEERKEAIADSFKRADRQKIFIKRRPWRFSG